VAVAAAVIAAAAVASTSAARAATAVVATNSPKVHKKMRGFRATHFFITMARYCSNMADTNWLFVWTISEHDFNKQ
jgi:hypothetical protein